MRFIALPCTARVQFERFEQQLVMVQCQQITSAIRMVLDEARRTQKTAERKAAESGRWQIMQLSGLETGQATGTTRGLIIIIVIIVIIFVCFFSHIC